MPPDCHPSTIYLLSFSNVVNPRFLSLSSQAQDGAYSLSSSSIFAIVAVPMEILITTITRAYDPRPQHVRSIYYAPSASTTTTVTYTNISDYFSCSHAFSVMGAERKHYVYPICVPSQNGTDDKALHKRLVASSLIDVIPKNLSCYDGPYVTVT